MVLLGHRGVVGEGGAHDAMGRRPDLMLAFGSFPDPVDDILADNVPGVLAANDLNDLLLGPDRQRLSGHAHDLIAHRRGGEVVNPRHRFHELARPCRRRAGVLTKGIHRAVAGELERLGGRDIQRIGDPLELSFLRLALENP